VTPQGEFSPVENELPLRWYRRLRLAPADGVGAGRRAVLLALLTWVPIVAWALVEGRLVRADAGEPLLHHYGVHVRCLLAIPLFIFAEAALDKMARRVVAQFRATGVVGADHGARFDAVIADVRRLRDASLPWVLVIGAAIGWTLVERPAPHEDAVSWATEAGGGLGFGGLWFTYVVRPIYLAMLLGWIWRILLVAYWFWRVGRLELSIVPTHADRTGGLAFVEKVPGAFAMVTFALSAMIGSHWAHEIERHGALLQSFKMPGIAFVVLWTLFALLPLFALAPALFAARARAIPAYSALVAEHGRLVHERWIRRAPVGAAPILEAPEIGPVADANVMYDAVKRMRPLPIGRSAILGILVPMALPLIVVAALQVPLKDLLLKLVRTLV
jgi:hypothetical protein